MSSLSGLKITLYTSNNSSVLYMPQSKSSENNKQHTDDFAILRVELELKSKVFSMDGTRSKVRGQ